MYDPVYISTHTRHQNEKLICVREEHLVTGDAYMMISNDIWCLTCFKDSDLPNYIECRDGTECKDLLHSPVSLDDNGMCEPCREVTSPLSQEDQEGWNDNIQRWNE